MPGWATRALFASALLVPATALASDMCGLVPFLIVPPVGVGVMIAIVVGIVVRGEAAATVWLVLLAGGAATGLYAASLLLDPSCPNGHDAASVGIGIVLGLVVLVTFGGAMLALYARLVAAARARAAAAETAASAPAQENS